MMGNGVCERINFDYTVCSIGIGDTDGDGRLEVVVKTEILYVVDYTGGRNVKMACSYNWQ